MILESHENISNIYGNSLFVFEAISIYIFSFEYLYRLYLAFRENKFKGVFKYIPVIQTFLIKNPFEFTGVLNDPEFLFAAFGIIPK